MLYITNNILLKTLSRQSTTQQSPNSLKFKTENKDTVSFGYIDAPLPSKDLQLYRAIGQRELRALLNGQTIEGHSYATSDPRGWAASNWHSGFAHNNKNPYFVTFKTGDENFDIMDRRDSFADTRYSVGDYNLSNVQNIRKGHNAHGELIYSENFEYAKEIDKQTKLQEIKRLTNELKKLQIRNGINKFLSKIQFNNSETTDKKDIMRACIYDELGSYAKEFPNIIDELKPLSVNDDHCTNMLLNIIADVNRYEDLQFVREQLHKFAEHKFPVDDSSLRFIQKNGSEEDVDLILDI